MFIRDINERTLLLMKLKYIGLTAIVLIAAGIIGYKMHLSKQGQLANQSATPRVLLVANLAEANEEGDACAEMIHLVRATHDRGIVVQELDASSKSPLLARYHVLIIPTVLIFDRNGKEISRLEGESGDVVQKLRIALAQLK